MLLRRQATEDRDEHIDMTPMVDVVFQLMTFMLFSMQISGGEDVDVPAARHGVGVDESTATVVRLLKPVPPAAAPRLLLVDGSKAVPATLDQARAFAQAGVRQGRRKIVLQADGAVAHGEVVKAAAALAEVEGVTLHIGVQERSP